MPFHPNSTVKFEIAGQHLSIDEEFYFSFGNRINLAGSVGVQSHTRFLADTELYVDGKIRYDFLRLVSANFFPTKLDLPVLRMPHRRDTACHSEPLDLHL